MSIKAKMNCTSVTKTGWKNEAGDLRHREDVTLEAVYGDGDENKSFSDATPSAKVTMTIDNQEAIGKFTPGKPYYVDFTPAE